MKKIYSIVMAICLIMAFMPSMAFAEGGNESQSSELPKAFFISGGTLDDNGNITGETVKKMFTPGPSGDYYIAKKDGENYVILKDVGISQNEGNNVGLWAAKEDNKYEVDFYKQVNGIIISSGDQEYVIEGLTFKVGEGIYKKPDSETGSISVDDYIGNVIDYDSLNKDQDGKCVVYVVAKKNSNETGITLKAKNESSQYEEYSGKDDITISKDTTEIAGQGLVYAELTVTKDLEKLKKQKELCIFVGEKLSWFIFFTPSLESVCAFYYDAWDEVESVDDWLEWVFYEDTTVRYTNMKEAEDGSGAYFYLRIKADSEPTVKFVTEGTEGTDVTGVSFVEYTQYEEGYWLLKYKMSSTPQAPSVKTTLIISENSEQIWNDSFTFEWPQIYIGDTKGKIIGEPSINLSKAVTDSENVFYLWYNSGHDIEKDKIRVDRQQYSNSNSYENWVEVKDALTLGEVFTSSTRGYKYKTIELKQFYDHDNLKITIDNNENYYGEFILSPGIEITYDEKAVKRIANTFDDITSMITGEEGHSIKVDERTSFYSGLGNMLRNDNKYYGGYLLLNVTLNDGYMIDSIENSCVENDSKLPYEITQVQYYKVYNGDEELEATKGNADNLKTGRAGDGEKDVFMIQQPMGGYEYKNGTYSPIVPEKEKTNLVKTFLKECKDNDYTAELINSAIEYTVIIENRSQQTKVNLNTSKVEKVDKAQLRNGGGQNLEEKTADLTEEQMKEMQQNLENYYDKEKQIETVLDLSLANGGQLSKPTDVVIPVEGNANDYEIVWITDDGYPVPVKTLYTTGGLMFTTSHFSKYALVKKADETGGFIPSSLPEAAESVVENQKENQETKKPTTTADLSKDTASKTETKTETVTNEAAQKQ